MNRTVKNLGLTLVTALLGAGATVTAGAMIVGLGHCAASAHGVEAHAATDRIAPVIEALPMPGFRMGTAVGADPQRDLVPRDGVSWSVAENAPPRAAEPARRM